MNAADDRPGSWGKALTGRMGAAWTRTKQLFAKVTSTLPGRHA
jgi:hypothetical protein